MAHFAKLDDNNIVLEIHVVSNDALDSSDEENSGIAFLTEWSGGYTKWKQTSYNGTFRKKYAGIGDYYDEQRDAFYPPNKPFDSWTLNEETASWEAPIPLPLDGKFYSWNEENLEWVEILVSE